MYALGLKPNKLFNLQIFLMVELALIHFTNNNNNNNNFVEDKKNYDAYSEYALCFRNDLNSVQNRPLEVYRCSNFTILIEW